MGENGPPIDESPHPHAARRSHWAGTAGDGIKEGGTLRECHIVAICFQYELKPRRGDLFIALHSFSLIIQVLRFVTK